MTKPVMNISDVELKPRPAAFAATGSAAERFDARMGMIAPLIGAQKLGYNLTAVPPGKRAFPFHNHPVNEESRRRGRGADNCGSAGQAHTNRWQATATGFWDQ